MRQQALSPDPITSHPCLLSSSNPMESVFLMFGAALDLGVGSKGDMVAVVDVAVCLLPEEPVSGLVFPLFCFLRRVACPADWFGNLIRTGATESSAPQLNSLTLELSSQLSEQLGETGLGGGEGGMDM